MSTRDAALITALSGDQLVWAGPDAAKQAEAQAAAEAAAQEEKEAKEAHAEAAKVCSPGRVFCRLACTLPGSRALPTCMAAER